MEGLRVTVERESQACWGVRVNGAKVVTGESHTVASNIADALRRPESWLPGECHEVAEAIRRRFAPCDAAVSTLTNLKAHFAIEDDGQCMWVRPTTREGKRFLAGLEQNERWKTFCTGYTAFDHGEFYRVFGEGE